ncbi:MAG: hypothetical protein NC548_20155 [Lachnospiraceae bacterium]|nr:hypothetical protein [Lachnospiraceae bacterium]
MFEPGHWQYDKYRTLPRTDAEIIIVQRYRKCKTYADICRLENGFGCGDDERIATGLT